MPRTVCFSLPPRVTPTASTERARSQPVSVSASASWRQFSFVNGSLAFMDSFKTTKYVVVDVTETGRLCEFKAVSTELASDGRDL